MHVLKLIKLRNNIFTLAVQNNIQTCDKYLSFFANTYHFVPIFLSFDSESYQKCLPLTRI